MAGSKSQAAELIDKLAKAPLKIKLVLLVAALGVMVGGYWYLGYSSLAEEQATLLAQRKKLADEEKNLQGRKKDYLDLLQKKLELEEELKKNAVRLPASSELPAFFVHLQSQATAANVQLVKWTREGEYPVENYVKVPVRMEVRGDFYQLNQYFKLLYETPRIITIENLRIGDRKAENDSILLTATFTASTFRQSDQAASAVAAGKPGAPATPAAPGKPTQAGVTPPAEKK